jgi:hypothetical protein
MKRAKYQREQPNALQLAALESYAKAHGRTWKRQLWHAWASGRYWDGDASGALQTIRNQFGPSWLVRFRLPKAGRP